MNQKRKGILPRKKWPLLIFAVLFFLAIGASFEVVGSALDKVFGLDDKNASTPSVVSSWAKVIVVALLSLFALLSGLALLPWAPVIGVILIIGGLVWLLSTAWEVKKLTGPKKTLK